MMKIMVPRWHSAQGFTLIELLVSISLIAFLLVLAVPSFTQMNNNARLDDNTRRVMSAFETTYNLAHSAVQPGVRLSAYRMQLLASAGSPAGCYQGYQINQINEAGNVEGVALEQEQLSCGYVIQSTVPQISYDVPTGQVIGLTGRTAAYRVCNPGYGYYDVTVDVFGKVVKGQIVKSTAGCTCPSSCSALSTPTPIPTSTPTRTPTPTTIPAVPPPPTNTPTPLPPTATPTRTPTPVPPTNTPTPVPPTATPAGGTTLIVRARGTLGGGAYPQMVLTVNNVTVQTWTTTATLQNYSVAVPGSVAASQVKVHYVNDANGRDLIVDYLQVNSTVYQTEASSTFSTGSWSGVDCSGGYYSTEMLACVGYFQYNSAGLTAINVMANGSWVEGAQPRFEIRFKNTVVGTWSTEGWMRPFGAAVSGPVVPADVTVHLINDTGPQDLQVDYMKINTTVYQTESPTVYSVGSWNAATGCSGGYKQNEWLHCNGYFQY